MTKKEVFQTDELVALLESMPRVKASADGQYNFTDRARDFTIVFNSEAGRRVLSQIHQICDPVARIQDADKPGTLAFKDGMRRVMGEIMLCFVVKGPIVIEKQSSEKEQGQ